MHTHIFSAQKAFLSAILSIALLITSFFVLEPTIGRTQINSDFTVSQSITAEISFLVTAANVNMVGSIAGLTGGYATGTTMTVVNTNNSTGYNMTLGFSSTTAMKLNNGSSTINNYTPATPGTPDFIWQDNTTGQSAEFGYTFRASTTG